MVQDYNSVYKEVFMVLAYFDEEMIKKIPDTMLNKIKECAAESKKEVFIDFSKDINDQNISEDAKDFISILYYNYIANENEKKEIENAWKENEKEFQESFDTSKLFENKRIEEYKNEHTEMPYSALMQKKNNIFKSIWIKIKQILNMSNKVN